MITKQSNDGWRIKMAQNYPAKLHINSMAAIPGQA